MGSNTTTPQLLAALKEFCRSGVPNVLWSDQGPQFSSKMFQEFAAEWGFKHVTSSPTYPQSNEKAEATVKSMKKMLGPDMVWMTPSWLGGCCSIVILHLGDTATHLPRSCSATQYRTLSPPIIDLNGSLAPSWWILILQLTESRLSSRSTTALPGISVKSNVVHVIENPISKLWDIHGVVVDMSPFWRYFVKTSVVGFSYTTGA